MTNRPALSMVVRMPLVYQSAGNSEPRARFSRSAALGLEPDRAEHRAADQPATRAHDEPVGSELHLRADAHRTRVSVRSRPRRRHRESREVPARERECLRRGAEKWALVVPGELAAGRPELEQTDHSLRTPFGLHQTGALEVGSRRPPGSDPDAPFPACGPRRSRPAMTAPGTARSASSVPTGAGARPRFPSPWRRRHVGRRVTAIRCRSTTRDRHQFVQEHYLS